VVDVLAVVNDNTCDRLLIGLAVAGPLLMLVLNAWRASLDAWYVPVDADRRSYFGAQFEHDVSDWLETAQGTGAALVVIADRDCPCTRPALARFDEAVARSGRRDVRLIVRDINDAADGGIAWRRVVSGVPATPSLLAVDNRRLLYAGPIASGSFCASAVGEVLGLAALQAPRANPLFNLLNKGCYCRSRAWHGP
jgi:hypothetical protein